MDRRIFLAILISSFVFSAGTSLYVVLRNSEGGSYTNEHLTTSILYFSVLSLFALINFILHAIVFEKKVGFKNYRPAGEEHFQKASSAIFSSASPYKPLLFMSLMLFLLPYSLIFFASIGSNIYFWLLLVVYPFYYSAVSYLCFLSLIYFIIKICKIS